MNREQWKAVAGAVYSRFGEVQITDRAATLAYYGFLSLFPALIVAVALLALFGSYPETYESIIDTLRETAPGPAVDTIDSALRDVAPEQRQRRRAARDRPGGRSGLGLRGHGRGDPRPGRDQRSEGPGYRRQPGRPAACSPWR